MFGLFIHHDLLPWFISKCVLWPRGLLALTWLEYSLLKGALRTVREELKSQGIFNDNFDFNQFFAPGVVYIRLSLQSKHFYIGSTRLTMFERDQSRKQKFHQLTCNATAYFEPALKLWKATCTFDQFLVLPMRFIRNGDVAVAETTLQYILRPSLSHPWINPLLRKLRVQPQFHRPQVTGAQARAGRRLRRRFGKHTHMKLRHRLTQWFDRQHSNFCLRLVLIPETSSRRPGLSDRRR